MLCGALRCVLQCVGCGVLYSVNFNVSCNVFPVSVAVSATLQHMATHGNTLQHTATHCNTLQHTTTHGNTRQHTATHCNTLQHTATHCNTLHHAAKHCNTLQRTTATCDYTHLDLDRRVKTHHERDSECMYRCVCESVCVHDFVNTK